MATMFREALDEPLITTPAVSAAWELRTNGLEGWIVNLDERLGDWSNLVVLSDEKLRDVEQRSLRIEPHDLEISKNCALQLYAAASSCAESMIDETASSNAPRGCWLTPVIDEPRD